MTRTTRRRRRVGGGGLEALSAALAALLIHLGAAVPVLAAADPLAEARSLYAAAAYEETLTLLTTVDDPGLADQVDEYRTLCFLALNREAEAVQAMETIVRRHPIQLADLDDRSPKFAALYRGVQTRLIPALASEGYGIGKRAYDAGEYPVAAERFTHVLALLRAASGAGLPPTAAPLELLASGFLALAERRVADAGSPRLPGLSEPDRLGRVGGAGVESLLTASPFEPAPAIARPVEQRPVQQPDAEPPLFTPVPRVYSVEDVDVTPPVAIEQKLPVWRPPNEAVRDQTFSGQIEILIDVDGRVVDAEIRRPSHRVFDDQLLRAVKLWRYQPASKRAYPVQYRRTVDYVLRPPTPESR